MQPTQNSGPAKTRYEQLKSSRDPFLIRGRECALYTIPTLVPPDGANSVTIYPTPYQSLGARGVNNLASKLVLSLFPPNQPNFKLAIDDFALEKLTQKEGSRAEVEEAFNRMERAVMTEIETSPTRAPAFEGIKHLLVAGNGLFFMQPTGGFKLFRLDQYVTKRDPSGHVLEIITMEKVAPVEIPKAARDATLGEMPKQGEGEPASCDDSVEIYTHVCRCDDKWTIVQEINGKKVPGSEGSYPLDKSPWLPLRFIAISGEDYGRGFVEEYLGDLKSLEGLTKAIVQAAAVAAKVLFLVRPNATTSAKELAKKESGGFAAGVKEDITVLSLEKFNDFRVALDMRKDIMESLSFSFLLNTAVQRNGERVTAEEIRYMANELETGLGGVYSTLSQELQLPVVTVLMHRMEKAKKLPTLPKGIVKPMITTGVDAIGRGNDITKLRELLADLQPLGPENIATWLNVGDFITRCATARGIDKKGLINDAATVAATQKQQQMMGMVSKLGPNAITQAGQMAQKQIPDPNQGAAA